MFSQTAVGVWAETFPGGIFHVKYLWYTKVFTAIQHYFRMSEATMGIIECQPPFPVPPRSNYITLYATATSKQTLGSQITIIIVPTYQTIFE